MKTNREKISQLIEEVYTNKDGKQIFEKGDKQRVLYWIDTIDCELESLRNRLQSLQEIILHL